jgi:cytochrome oxidase assembly protein ShyY1
VLVNRGWIPWSDYKNWRETGSVPEYLKIQSPTTVHGVTQPDDKPTKKVVFDMPRVHPLLRAQEILEKDAPPVIGCTAITAFSVEAVDPRNFLRAADPTIPLIRRPLPATRGADDFIFGYVTPEKHIEYATFWFGCCLSVLVLHYAVGRRGTRGRRPRLR